MATGVPSSASGGHGPQRGPQGSAGGGTASNAALDELHGLGFQHTDRETAIYESITPDQIRSVVAQYLNPEHAVVALITRDPQGAVGSP